MSEAPQPANQDPNALPPFEFHMDIGQMSDADLRSNITHYETAFGTTLGQLAERDQPLTDHQMRVIGNAASRYMNLVDAALDRDSIVATLKDAPKTEEERRAVGREIYKELTHEIDSAKDENDLTVLFGQYANGEPLTAEERERAEDVASLIAKKRAAKLGSSQTDEDKHIMEGIEKRNLMTELDPSGVENHVAVLSSIVELTMHLGHALRSNPSLSTTTLEAVENDLVNLVNAYTAAGGTNEEAYAHAEKWLGEIRGLLDNNTPLTANQTPEANDRVVNPGQPPMPPEEFRLPEMSAEELQKARRNLLIYAKEAQAEEGVTQNATPEHREGRADRLREQLAQLEGRRAIDPEDAQIVRDAINRLRNGSTPEQQAAREAIAAATAADDAAEAPIEPDEPIESTAGDSSEAVDNTPDEISELDRIAALPTVDEQLVAYRELLQQLKAEVSSLTHKDEKAAEADILAIKDRLLDLGKSTEGRRGDVYPLITLAYSILDTIRTPGALRNRVIVEEDGIELIDPPADQAADDDDWRDPYEFDTELEPTADTTAGETPKLEDYIDPANATTEAGRQPYRGPRQYRRRRFQHRTPGVNVTRGRYSGFIEEDFPRAYRAGVSLARLARQGAQRLQAAASPATPPPPAAGERPRDEAGNLLEDPKPSTTDRTPPPPQGLKLSDAPAPTVGAKEAVASGTPPPPQGKRLSTAPPPTRPEPLSQPPAPTAEAAADKQPGPAAPETLTEAQRALSAHFELLALADKIEEAGGTISPDDQAAIDRYMTTIVAYDRPFTSYEDPELEANIQRILKLVTKARAQSNTGEAESVTVS